jgi:hypothetical protein
MRDAQGGSTPFLVRSRILHCLNMLVQLLHPACSIAFITVGVGVQSHLDRCVTEDSTHFSDWSAKSNKQTGTCVPQVVKAHGLKPGALYSREPDSFTEVAVIQWIPSNSGEDIVVSALGVHSDSTSLKTDLGTGISLTLRVLGSSRTRRPDASVVHACSMRTVS